MNTQTASKELLTETGNRSLSGLPLKIFTIGCILWSCFQLWYASPLPFILNIGKINDTEARSIHLAFSIFLAFIGFAFTAKIGSKKVPIIDWGLAILGSFCALYIFLFYSQLADRAGAPTLMDKITASIGLLIMLEAARRSLGPALVTIASIFLIYALAGPYMPSIIAHKGASLNKLLSHQWLTTEGVFGVALGVSTGFVFLFVLFGAMMERAGAGNYFIKVAFSLLGHMRGGPAKAAVVSSGLSGIISGSSIANVVTTGNFTIPVMKKVGFPAHKAGAVEVAASTNGQLTPPIMGAAAFLMVEYVNIPYIEVIKHAILPALISYIALVYIVHLEAVKAGFKGLPRKEPLKIMQFLIGLSFFVVTFGVLSLAVYYGIGWIKIVAPEYSLYIVGLGIFLTYIVAVIYSARFPDLEEDDWSRTISYIPQPGPTFKAGIYYLLPVVVLIWCLAVERLSPGLSVFYGMCFMIFILLTHRPLAAFIRGNKELLPFWRRGFQDFIEGMIMGARNMVGIGVATATAGVIVGTVTLTGIGDVMIALVELLSGGNLIIILILTAITCLVLGMGLPTTANYIVVSALMAPVIVELGAQNDLIVPLIAVHMFVFYFGILADDTPPVGLAAFAASAIARSDPIKTGIQGFTYDIRTAILPFMFIFNTELLLIDIDSFGELLLIIFAAITAMLVFAAATQNFWLTKCKWWETVALLLIAFTLFRPNFWMDRIITPYEYYPGSDIEVLVDKYQVKESLRIKVRGNVLSGDLIEKTVILPLPNEGNAQERIGSTGLSLDMGGELPRAGLVDYGTPASQAGIDFGWEIINVQLEKQRPPPEIFYIPALTLLGLIWFLQRRRMKPSLATVKK